MYTIYHTDIAISFPLMFERSHNKKKYCSRVWDVKLDVENKKLDKTKYFELKQFSTQTTRWLEYTYIVEKCNLYWSDALIFLRLNVINMFKWL